MRYADCHPTEKYHAKGLCKRCYFKSRTAPSLSLEKAREYSAKWRANNREKDQERRRRWEEAHPEWRPKWRKERYLAKDPNRAKARAAVGNAITAGRLARQPCEVCGAAKAEAHHYLGLEPEHWFDLQWLCRPHHQVAHGGVWKPIDKAA